MIFFSNALTGRLKPEYRIINDRLTGSKQYRSAHSRTDRMVLSSAYEYQRGHFPLYSISCAPDTERTWIAARTARRKGKSGTEPALYSFSLVRSTALWYDKCIHKAVHHEHRKIFPPVCGTSWVLIWPHSRCLYTSQLVVSSPSIWQGRLSQISVYCRTSAGTL